jgi:hypothetical protein
MGGGENAGIDMGTLETCEHKKKHKTHAQNSSTLRDCVDVHNAGIVDYEGMGTEFVMKKYTEE